MVDMHTSSEPDDQWEQHEPDWALHNTDSLLYESSQWTETNCKKFFLSWNTINRLKKTGVVCNIVGLPVSPRKIQFGLKK